MTEKQHDNHLAREAVAGNIHSLETLLKGIQGWIYNISFKMVMDHDEASDVTQEILIKIITSLSTFDETRGSFTTWVYRITANHVISMKRSKMENLFTGIERYVSMIESVPDHRNISHPESDAIQEDIRISCMAGMLICLGRQERLVFILGGVFGITDSEGADVLEISRDNFRKILSRGREKVFSHVNGFCGHVNPDGRCRCSLKMKAFLDSGRIDPAALKFNRPFQRKIREEAETRIEGFRVKYFDPFFEIFRGDPFYTPPDMTVWLRETIKSREFREIFNFH